MLSAVVPSIRPANLQRLYESIQSSYSGEFEFIVIGPYRMPLWFDNKTNIVYIEDYGSPTRAQQIGIVRAKGEYVLWGGADDGWYLPGAVDIAMKTVGPKTVVIGRYYEGSDNPAMNERKYYQINTHTSSRSKYIDNECLMLMVGVLPRELLVGLGGLDAIRFETLPMAFIDLSARMFRYGASLELQDEIMFRCTHMPGHMGDHGPIHDGQTLHDEPEFRAMYNDPTSLKRTTIDISNWQQAPAKWVRRFGA